MKTKCQEVVDLASTSTALSPEAMVVSDEKYVCSSPFSEGDSSKSTEGTTEEPVSNSSSSVICSNLDCGDDPGLWLNNVVILLIFWLFPEL